MVYIIHRYIPHIGPYREPLPMFSQWFPRAKPHLAPRSGRPNAVATADSGADGVGGEGWAAGEVFNKCGSQGDQGHPIDNGWDLWFVTPKKIIGISH